MSVYVLVKSRSLGVFKLVSAGSVAIVPPICKAKETGTTTTTGTPTGLVAKVVTTQPTTIKDNRFVLPSTPQGTIILGLAIVSAPETGSTELYTNITVSEISGNFYACFNEPAPVLGTGVVSYLTYNGL
jgi:hypothetical protein